MFNIFFVIYITHKISRQAAKNKQTINESTPKSYKNGISHRFTDLNEN